MRYGHFDDEAREYVITTPHTPYPWINYLGSQEFFSLISHQAGGYSFYRDAKMRRLTRYRYNNVPADAGGRYFYIHDDGDVWTPSWMPVKADLEHREPTSYEKGVSRFGFLLVRLMRLPDVAFRARVRGVSLLGAHIAIEEPSEVEAWRRAIAENSTST